MMKSQVFVACLWVFFVATSVEGLCVDGEKCIDIECFDCVPCPDGQYQSRRLHKEIRCQDCSLIPSGFHWKLLSPCTPEKDSVWTCEDGYRKSNELGIKDQYICVSTLTSTTTTTTTQSHTEKKNTSNTPGANLSTTVSASSGDQDGVNLLVVLVGTIFGLVVVVVVVAIIVGVRWYRKKKHGKENNHWQKLYKADSGIGEIDVEDAALSYQPTCEEAEKLTLSFAAHKTPDAVNNMMDAGDNVLVGLDLESLDDQNTSNAKNRDTRDSDGKDNTSLAVENGMNNGDNGSRNDAPTGEIKGTGAAANGLPQPRCEAAEKQTHSFAGHKTPDAVNNMMDAEDNALVEGIDESTVLDLFWCLYTSKRVDMESLMLHANMFDDLNNFLLCKFALCEAWVLHFRDDDNPKVTLENIKNYLHPEDYGKLVARLKRSQQKGLKYKDLFTYLSENIRESEFNELFYWCFGHCPRKSPIECKEFLYTIYEYNNRNPNKDFLHVLEEYGNTRSFVATYRSRGFTYKLSEVRGEVFKEIPFHPGEIRNDRMAFKLFCCIMDEVPYYSFEPFLRELPVKEKAFKMDALLNKAHEGYDQIKCAVKWWLAHPGCDHISQIKKTLKDCDLKYMLHNRVFIEGCKNAVQDDADGADSQGDTQHKAVIDSNSIEESNLDPTSPKYAPQEETYCKTVVDLKEQQVLVVLTPCEKPGKDKLQKGVKQWQGLNEENNSGFSPPNGEQASVGGPQEVSINGDEFK